MEVKANNSMTNASARYFLVIVTWLTSAMSISTFVWRLIAPSWSLILVTVAFHVALGMIIAFAVRKDGRVELLPNKEVAAFGLAVTVCYAAAILLIIGAMLILYRAPILWWLFAPGGVLLVLIVVWTRFGTWLAAPRRTMHLWMLPAYLLSSLVVAFLPLWFLGRTYY